MHATSPVETAAVTEEPIDVAAMDSPRFSGTLRQPWAPASLVRNAAANWALLASSIAYSLLVTPWVVRALGTEGYGVWSFLNGLTAYADLFYLGLGASLVRYLAEYRALNDLRSMRRLCSVVFTIYLAIGGLLLVLAIGLSPLVPELLGSQLRGTTAGAASTACVLIGARLTALFAGSVFSGMLFAHDRNDVFKAVMVTFTLVRFVLIVLFVRDDDALVVLAAISALTGFLEAIVMAALAWAVSGGIRPGLVLPRVSDVRPLYAFGALSFLVQVSSKLISYTDTTVLGVKLGADAVAQYTLPLQLVEYGRYGVAALVGVVLPRLVILKASGEHDVVGSMFLRLARLSAFLGVVMNIGFLSLGTSFLRWWVGPVFGTADAQWILVWLSLASICQVVSTQVPLPFYQSLNRLAFPVAVLMIEAVTNLAASLWLARPFGPAGVAFATLIPSVLVTLVFLPAHLCRQLGVSVRHLFVDNLAPYMGVGAAVTGGVFFAMNRMLPIDSLSVLALKGTCGVAVASALFLRLFPSEDRRLVTGPLQLALRRITANRLGGPPSVHNSEK